MTGFRATDFSLASRTLPEHAKPTTYEPKTADRSASADEVASVVRRPTIRALIVTRL